MTGWLLLVEDDRDIQASLRDLLEMEGYEVVSAYNGQQALEILREARTLPRLVLLDLMMPVMHGGEFRAAQLGDPRLANVPVIVMSADGESSRLAPADVSGYLRKPADVEQVLQAVAPYFAANRPRRPQAGACELPGTAH